MNQENKNQKKQDSRASNSIVNQNQGNKQNNTQNSETNSTEMKKKRDESNM